MTPEMTKVLKDAGLEIIEESTLTAAKVLIKALPALALATDNKIDDLFVPVIGLLSPQLIALIDKINPNDN